MSLSRFNIDHIDLNNIDEFLKKIELSKLKLKRFDDEVIEFLSEFSSKILLNNSLRKYPELIVLANWFRKRNIFKIKEAHSNFIKHPLGTIFHVAPGNVDTIFIYSMFISLLNGNKNIVKISHRESELINEIIHTIDEVLCNPAFDNLRGYISIIRYENQEEITTKLSKICNCRVLWGGDNTINQISRLPLNPRALEVKFSDRFSFSVINSDIISSLTDKELEELSERFVNDLTFFNQEACSSTKLIYWVGKKNKSVIEKWWDICRKKIGSDILVPPIQTDRFVNQNLIAANLDVKVEHDPSIPVITLYSPNKNDLNFLRNNHFGNILCSQIFLKNLDMIGDLLSEKDQTCSYYGFLEDDLVKVFWNRSSVDRVVPIGKSLDFNYIWDGYNLFEVFSRHIGKE